MNRSQLDEISFLAMGNCFRDIEKSTSAYLKSYLGKEISCTLKITVECEILHEDGNIAESMLRSEGKSVI